MPGLDLITAGLRPPSHPIAGGVFPLPSPPWPSSTLPPGNGPFGPLYAASPPFSQAADRFERITIGTLHPFNNPAYSVSIEITPAGGIVQNTLSGPQIVGQLDSQGNYQLNNGQSGNIFLDDTLRVSYQYGDNPFLASLRNAERRRAAAGSEVAFIRARLHALGIDGRGVKVGILDAYELGGEGENEAGQTNNTLDQANSAQGSRIHQHSYTVGSVINDPIWGIAPGAQVIDAGFRINPEPQPDRDNLNAYIQQKLKGYCQIYDTTGAQLQHILSQNDPALLVLSLTWGSSRVKMYLDVIQEVNAKDDNGDYKWPQVRAAVLGNTVTGTLDDRIQAVIRFVDFLCSQPVVQQAHARYIETTRQLAERGINLVVAAGNDRNAIDSTALYPPGAEFNDLAKSPYIIAVAACDTNQTPGYHADDKISPFSSRGDGLLWNPTITAPGQEIHINRQYGSIGRNQVIQGTSYATPYVAGVISMMLQKNPALNFNQIKAILQATGTRIAAPIHETGTGVVNPYLAVLSA